MCLNAVSFVSSISNFVLLQSTSMSVPMKLCVDVHTVGQSRCLCGNCSSWMECVLINVRICHVSSLILRGSQAVLCTQDMEPQYGTARINCSSYVSIMNPYNGLHCIMRACVSPGGVFLVYSIFSFSLKRHVCCCHGSENALY